MFTAAFQVPPHGPSSSLLGKQLLCAGANVEQDSVRAQFWTRPTPSFASVSCCPLSTFSSIVPFNNAKNNNNNKRRPFSLPLLFGSTPSREGEEYSSSPLSNKENGRKGKKNKNTYDNNDNDDITSAEVLRSELERVESMEEISEEIEEYYYVENAVDDDTSGLTINLNEMLIGDDVENSDFWWSEETLSDIFGDLHDDDEEADDEDVDFDEFLDSILDESTAKATLDEKEEAENAENGNAGGRYDNQNNKKQPAFLVTEAGMVNLERALLQGVVPVSADVGSDALPGDFGFDPLNLATKDYFRPTQQFLLSLLPDPADEDNDGENNKDSFWGQPQLQQAQSNNKHPRRPKALILRDYREAEIRHGRLAMLAAVFWPLQEMLDQLLLDKDQAGPLIYGPMTLPYFPLLMTLIMLLLGYLDIYSQAIKDRDSIGEAFLPGDCFWDPLRILEGAPDSMKRNMQERELFNCRAAMIAVAVFTWEEAITHLPLNEIQGNELLLRPLYQVPYVQEWLDSQFSFYKPLSEMMSSSDDIIMDFSSVDEMVVQDTLESLE